MTGRSGLSSLSKFSAIASSSIGEEPSSCKCFFLMSGCWSGLAVSSIPFCALPPSFVSVSVGVSTFDNDDSCRTNFYGESISNLSRWITLLLGTTGSRGAND